VKEVRPPERGGNVKTIIMKGVKHYTEEGEYKGKTHKMDGKVHTGAEHSDSSKVVSHKPEGPFKMRTPFQCWSGYTANGKTKPSPSGKKTPGGNIKMVPDCKPK